MAALVFHAEDSTKFVTGGAISKVIGSGRMANGSASHSAQGCKGDLLLALAASTNQQRPQNDYTCTKRSRSQRDVLRQTSGSKLFSSIDSAELSSDEACSPPVVHNLRDSRSRFLSNPQSVSAIPNKNTSWHFNLALQSSML